MIYPCHLWTNCSENRSVVGGLCPKMSGLILDWPWNIRLFTDSVLQSKDSVEIIPTQKVHSTSLCSDKLYLSCILILSSRYISTIEIQVHVNCLHTDHIINFLKNAKSHVRWLRDIRNGMEKGWCEDNTQR